MTKRTIVACGLDLDAVTLMPNGN